MKQNKLIFLLLFITTSCETLNSNSFDDQLYNSDVQIEDASLIEPYAILRNACMNCHSDTHNSWSLYTSNQDWINSGLIIAGDPANSLLLQRMINTPSSEAGGQNQNMPQNGSAIDDQDYQKLRTWIQNI